MTRPLAQETLRQFRILIGAVRNHFRHVEQTCGLSGAKVWILAEIADQPGLTVSELGDALSIHISTASNMLDKLAKAELVERRRSEQDRRLVHLHLTQAGQQVLQRAPKPLTGLLPDALNKLSEQELWRLHQDLSLLISQIDLPELGSGDKPLSTLVR